MGNVEKVKILFSNFFNRYTFRQALCKDDFLVAVQIGLKGHSPEAFVIDHPSSGSAHILKFKNCYHSEQNHHKLGHFPSPVRIIADIRRQATAMPLEIENIIYPQNKHLLL